MPECVLSALLTCATVSQSRTNGQEYVDKQNNVLQAPT